MTQNKYPINQYKSYHAHVYFEQETLLFATKLCQKLGEVFALPVGNVHQKIVGPHPKWSCQIPFTSEDFEQVIPWLEQNRNGLSVFVHALTGDNLKDHTDHAYWLGTEVALNLSMFEKHR